jgi:hypothetical protein
MARITRIQRDAICVSRAVRGLISCVSRLLWFPLLVPAHGRAGYFVVNRRVIRG